MASEFRSAKELQKEREWKGLEIRALRALIEMHAAQQAYVTVRPGGTSRLTFTNEELITAMRSYDHHIGSVAKHFNVSRGCIYNRLRELPPGATDKVES